MRWHIVWNKHFRKTFFVNNFCEFDAKKTFFSEKYVVDSKNVLSMFVCIHAHVHVYLKSNLI